MKMGGKGPDIISVVTVTVVAAVAAMTGMAVYEELAGTGWDQAICEQKHSGEWEYVNGSVDTENQTILCRSPSGEIVKTERELNMSGNVNTIVQSVT